MYFLVKCSNQSCESFSNLLPSYIGSCGKFDVFHSFKHIRCGDCFSKINLVDSIMFVACVWGYRGLIRNEKKVTTETDRKAYKIEFFDHKKGVVWDWLVINLKPLQQQQIFDNVNHIDNNKSFNDIVDEMINQFSIATQTSKYQKRYEKMDDETSKQTIKNEEV